MHKTDDWITFLLAVCEKNEETEDGVFLFYREEVAGINENGDGTLWESAIAFDI